MGEIRKGINGEFNQITSTLYVNTLQECNVYLCVFQPDYNYNSTLFERKPQNLSA